MNHRSGFGRSPLYAAFAVQALFSMEYGPVALPDRPKPLEDEAQYQAFLKLRGIPKPIAPLTTTTNDPCIAPGVVSQNMRPKIGRGERRRRAERKRRERIGIKPL